MGDKIESKKLAKEAKVSTIPGFLGEVGDTKEAIKIAREIGYPVMVKASAGGGGKGMRIAYNDKEAEEGFKLSREEAISSFGDGRLFVEKYIEAPRHIEYQLLGDEHGNYVYLPERECSVQRRNQKVIEEAPSSAMDPVTRKKMGEQAISLARACGYTSTGTCEFLMDKNKDFYFLEMNTRLQVEHPITEAISGVDLVEQQILIAAGYPLSFTQDDIKINGHSMEYRVYAEDPSRKFLPSIGFLKQYKEPSAHEHIRIDTGVQEGSEISMYYDPMISKLITWAPSRTEALKLLNKAMDEYVIKGVTHNLGFGQSILNNEAYATGNYNTAFIPTYYPTGFRGDPLTPKEYNQLMVAAHYMKNQTAQQILLEGQKAAPELKTVYITVSGEKDIDFKISKISDTEFEVTQLPDGKPQKMNIKDIDIEYNSLIRFKQDGEDKILQFLDSKDAYNFNFYLKGNTLHTTVYDENQYKYRKFMPEPKKINYAKSVISPMPGSIVNVNVEVGQTVAEGQDLITIEAMKMQNIIKSQVDGKIKKILTQPGQSVAVDQLLIEFE